ncbi:hypothetical protein [Chelatococcus reniformis]|uniref:Uncharacterized protein n=1 Tax=Chelatococcus reniformis TaxID=1494448 RepID=A0A916XKF1_9HYPH|nr:hypothetical protein [Chelatococcus reniformis]GGC78284.1 hypothetical protein GCM10010994_40650 [Chelatococcus reniformis]
MTQADALMRWVAGDNAVRRAMAWAGLFGIGWAGLELLLVAELREPLSLLQIVWCRYAVHLMIVLLIWGQRTPVTFWRTSRPVSHVCRSLMMIVMPGSFAIALAHGIAVEFVWSMFWMAPALIIAIAAVCLKERPPWAVVAASFVGALCVAAMFGHVRSPSLSAIGLALAAAGSFSLYVVLTRSLREQPLSTNMFYTAIAVFVAATPAMPSVWIWPDAHDLVLLTILGGAGFAVLLALDHACRAAPAWGGANALFTQAFCIDGVLSVVGGGALRPRVALGLTALVVLIGTLWIRADRFDIGPSGEPSSG